MGEELNKLLVVYNTCGVKRENIPFYIKAIESILSQDFDNMRVVVSMFKNSLNCKRELAKKFGNKISYIFYDENVLTINQTFNSTVKLCTQKYGKFDDYLYMDSGVILQQIDNKQNDQIFKKAYKEYKSGPYSIASVQVNHDAGYHQIGMKYSSDEVQIKNKNYVMPIGKAINLHLQFFSNDLYEALNNTLMPDIFVAYCTESVYSFCCAAINKKWIIIRDILVHHHPSMEGASASFPHHSLVHKNTWNNLMFGRDALDFINDQEAIDAGLGYEECQSIMMHKKSAYDENGFAKNPEKLKDLINKHLILTKEEFDYGKINYNVIWN